ncbi:MAG: hypothetical protein LBD41_08020 [Clostridiales Family XIII bacterium]|jgi:hypothetical protein|nr:hypothetical protein [Clostridiales Family XIII bacterium]
MNKKTIIKFTCEICGKESEKQIRHLEVKGNICRACLIKKYRESDKYKEDRKKTEQTNIERYGCKCSLGNKDIIRKREQTNLERYGATNPFSADSNLKDKILDIKKNKFEEGNYNNRKKARNTLLKNYGVEYTMQSPELLERSRQTSLEKYGKTSYTKTEEFKQKCQKAVDSRSPEERERINNSRKESLLKKFGVDNGFDLEQTRISLQKRFTEPDFFRNRALKLSQKRSKKEPINGIFADSIWEENFIKSHPGCKRGPCIEYKDENNKIHHWNIDFEWEGKLYEIKNPWMLREDNFWPGHSRLKFSLSKNLGIRWYLWNPGNWKWPILNKIEEFKSKECHVGKLKNPWEGFNDPFLKFKAEENLAKYITWPNMFEKFLKFGADIMLYERFTIAKIAPKVTEGPKSDGFKHFRHALKELKWNIKGVYNPCAGFGNALIAAKNMGFETRGADVNPKLIEFFGWEYRDVLKEKIILPEDWIVWTSPPVLDKETWGQNIEIKPMNWWYDKIQENVTASHYIFVNGTNDPTGGLFGNKNRKALFI